MAVRGFIELLRLQSRGRSRGLGLSKDSEIWSGVVFKLGELDLITPIGEIREVMDLPNLSPIFGVQAWLHGIAQLRGQILPVCDFWQFLTGGVMHKNSKILVLEGGNVLTALTVERVYGVEHFSQQSFQSDEQYLDDLPEKLQQYCAGYFEKNGMKRYVFLPSLLLNDANFINPKLDTQY